MAETITFYPDAHPETTTFDGRTFRAGVNETFATIRGGNGNGGNDTEAEELTTLIRATTTTNQYNTLSRLSFLFDTSSIPTGAKINSATFSIYLTAKNNQLGQSMGLVEATTASNTGFTTSDYQNTVSNTTLLANAITLTSALTDAYNDFTLNATGLDAIVKGGITKLGIRGSSDYGNSAPTWTSAHAAQITIRMADYTGTDFDPKLVVTFTRPSGNPLFFSLGATIG